MKNKIINTIFFLIIILVIIFISFLGLKHIKNLEFYTIEKDYVNAASYIYENNAIESGSEKEIIILTRNEMNTILSKPLTNFECNGYVEIKPSNQGPEYKAYIKCGNKYTTKNFKEYHTK